MVSFHILDVHSQDRQIIDEKEQLVEYVLNRGDEDDEEIKNLPNKSEMVIHLFGTVEDGKSLRVTLCGFEPYFYVEMPDNNKKSYDYFIRRLENYSKEIFPHMKREFMKAEKLYGYTNKTTFGFAKLSVPSLSLFYRLKKIFLNEKNNPKFKLDGYTYKVYEANLDPMLRFFHLRNINPCGWATIDCDYEANIEIDYNDIHPYNNSSIAVAPFKIGFWDIECYSSSGDFPLAKKDYSKVANILVKETTNYDEIKEKLLNMIQTNKIYRINKKLQYHEIDTYLSESKFKKEIDEYFEKNDLDSIILAKILKKHLSKNLSIAGDPVIQIGIVLTGGISTDSKHIFVLDSCDALDGIVVHSYKSEKEMILGFIEYLNDVNPDILIGYNVFGFDEKYLFHRMEELKIQFHTSFQTLSRIEDISNYTEEKPAVYLQEKFLSSSALGDNNLYIWTTTGRLHIDLYFYIKRIENLASYKLDDVCRHYMSGKLSSIKIDNEQYTIETKATSDAEVGKYLVLLDEIGDTIVEKRKIIEIIPKKAIIIEAPNDTLHNPLLETCVSWAIVKDDVTPAQIFDYHENGGSKGRAIVAKYCIQDCVLVQQLFNKLDVFNNAMAMANTCSVPVGFIFTRGQGIKCESLIFKECALRNQLIEVLPTPIQKGQEDYVEESYEGAIVLDPIPNFYAESPVGVSDFASLYPSTIISENISYDTLLWSKDYDMNYKFIEYSFGSKDSEKYLTTDVKFTDIEFDIWSPDPNDKRKNPEKIKVGIRICRYCQQPDDKKGSLPDILTKLLAARKEKRKQGEKETDPFKKALLDAEQLAYKLTANSLYGQLGSAVFKVRLQHLAASTTAYARKQIMFAKDAIETFYGPKANDPRCSAMTVYGDTDSLFINFNVINQETGEKLLGKEAIQKTIELTEEAGKFVTRCLKRPHDFEYDKVFYPFIIFSKKRYVGNKFEESAEHYKQTSMGIATKRRDYAPIVKNVYGGAIKILLNEKNILKAFNFVQATCNNLVDGKISEHQLTLTKSLRSEYKAVTPPAHRILADRIAIRDPGNAPTSGERMSFMYILPPVGQVASKLQGDRIETPSYIKEKGLNIDYRYYIEHQILNPISQLFGLFVEQLPGYVTPNNTMNIDEKEVYAGELLFKKIYEKCENQNLRSFANKFGFTVIPSKVKEKVTITEIQPQPSSKEKPKQQILNFPKLDRQIIQEYNTKKKEEKKQKKLEEKNQKTKTT